ncbi:hypothetical protein [Cohnella yongneupensis]|uniref:Sporulation membrane protein YtrI C-terminal domain-containing protein n=1 Tax=Cohnella yongneupensis TaxID=425006 RepID=A0ABW0R3E8_9BACL
MRVPSFDRFRRFMQITAFFVCGMIVGSAVYSALMNDQYDLVIVENRLLRQQVDAMKESLKNEEKIRKTNVIKSIVPYVVVPLGNPELDVLTETDIKKRLKADLDIFLGRSIYNIGTDAPLARKLLNKIVYEIGDKNYEMSVQTMLVSDGVLQVWVRVDVKTPKP